MVAALILTLAVILFRLAVPLAGGVENPAWANFSPLVAVVFCGAAFLPRRWAVGCTVAMVLVSDALLNGIHGAPVVSSYTMVLLAVVTLIFLAGDRVGRWLTRGRPIAAARGAAFTLGGTTAASVFFYVATSTFAFLASAAYAPTLAGWWQCLTVGTPGYPPSYLFFRNALAGDLLFAGVFLLALRPFVVESRTCAPATGARSTGSA